MSYLNKGIAVLLALVAFIATPITAKANSLSYIPPQETDGVPVEIRQIAEIVGAEFNICPELLEAMACQESTYKADATNGTCKGLMQINTGLHKERFTDAGWTTEDWDNAYKNMYVAADYLAELFDKYEDVALVLYYYNGDSTNLKRYKETGYLSYYVKSILEKSEELEYLHGKKEDF